MTTKAELIASVSSQSGESNATTESIINTTFEIIASGLKLGEEISIPKFGTFKVTDTKARTGRNPQTGAPIQIPAGRKISFKVAAALKESLK